MLYYVIVYVYIMSYYFIVGIISLCILYDIVLCYVMLCYMHERALAGVGRAARVFHATHP